MAPDMRAIPSIGPLAPRDNQSPTANGQADLEQMVTSQAGAASPFSREGLGVAQGAVFRLIGAPALQGELFRIMPGPQTCRWAPPRG
jgi:hypothetical protein